MRFIPVLASTLLLMVASPAVRADGTAVPASATAIQLSFAPVVKTTAPAVVNVYSQRKVVDNQSSSTFIWRADR